MNSDNENELLPIVDCKGEVIDKRIRKICHDGSKLLHPVVHLHVYNSKGELYLQKRPSWKPIQPNKWDTAVGGHISYGESVEESLQRETKEELNINDYQPIFVDKYIFESDVEKELVYIFKTVFDEPISPSDELDGGRFWNIQEIKKAIGQELLTPNLEKELVRFNLI